MLKNLCKKMSFIGNTVLEISCFKFFSEATLVKKCRAKTATFLEVRLWAFSGRFSKMKNAQRRSETRKIEKAFLSVFDAFFLAFLARFWRVFLSPVFGRFWDVFLKKSASLAFFKRFFINCVFWAFFGRF